MNFPSKTYTIHNILFSIGQNNSFFLHSLNGFFEFEEIDNLFTFGIKIRDESVNKLLTNSFTLNITQKQQITNL